jgi:hypothetical protein
MTINSLFTNAEDDMSIFLPFGKPFMRLILILILGVLISSCNNSQKSDPAKNDSDTSSAASPLPAADPPGVEMGDPESRCNTARGLRYSKLVKDCVVLVDLATLQPMDASAGANRTAHLIFDSVRVEIFLPTQASSVILRKSEEPGEAETWKNGPLRLTHADGKFRLEDDGKLLYEQQ